jgi:hypothetical protein
MADKERFVRNMLNVNGVCLRLAFSGRIVALLLDNLGADPREKPGE